MKKWVILIAAAVLVIAALVTGYFVFSVRELRLSTDKVDLGEGDSMQLEYELVPENALFGKEVQWSSSDVGIARVIDGKITGMSSGECMITARAGRSKAECRVKIRSKKETQSEMIDSISKYIEQNSDVDNSDTGSYLLQVRQDGDEYYMLAVKGDVLGAIYLDTSDGTQYQTMLLFERGNLQRADVSQVNAMIFDGRTLRTEAKGGIVPDTYHKGDRIKIEDMSVENAPEDAEIGVTEEFQKTVDKGTSKALTALEYFLNEHPMFGTIEKLGFQLE